MSAAFRAVGVTIVTIALVMIACGSETDTGSGGADTGSNGSSMTPFVQVVDGLPTEPAAEPAGTPEPDQAYVPEDSIDTEDKRLNVTVGDKIVYIRNGGTVMLGDGLAAEIFVDPYPPSTLRTWVDFYLTQDGEPVEDASIGVDYDMLSMVHGPFSGPAEKLGGGHYLSQLNYIMFGAWDQTITIRIGLDRIKIPLVLVAYP